MRYFCWLLWVEDDGYTTLRAGMGGVCSLDISNPFLARPRAYYVLYFLVFMTTWTCGCV